MRPIISFIDKPNPKGIIPNVSCLLLKRTVAANSMIEKSILPNDPILAGMPRLP